MFGHKILKDSWEIPESPQNLLDYVNGLGLGWYWQLNVKKEKLVKSQCQMKTLYDWHADPKLFQAGHQVLVLQPIRIRIKNFIIPHQGNCTLQQ